MKLLQIAMNYLIQDGSLILINKNGKEYFCGNQSQRNEATAIKFKKLSTAYGVLLKPWMKCGEAYMNGEIEIVQGDVRNWMALVFKNQSIFNQQNRNNYFHNTFYFFKRFFGIFRQLNLKFFSRKNIQHHYDVGNNVYTKFLDKNMQYSCAYFTENVLGGGALILWRNLRKNILL